MIEERQSTHVYRQKRLFTKEELEAREVLCVHEQPAYCNAACPLKLDTKAMVAAIAEGDFTKARALYEKITPFPHILAAGCEAPCEGKCKLCSLGEGIAIRELEAAAVRYGEPSKKRGLLRKKTKKAVIYGMDLFTLFLAGELAKKMYPVTVYCPQENHAALMAACAGEPRYPVYSPSKASPSFCQWEATAGISSVRSRKVQPEKPPVWVESTAVGMTAHSSPMEESTGRATVSEH